MLDSTPHELHLLMFSNLWGNCPQQWRDTLKFQMMNFCSSISLSHLGTFMGTTQPKRQPNLSLHTNGLVTKDGKFSLYTLLREVLNRIILIYPGKFHWTIFPHCPTNTFQTQPFFSIHCLYITYQRPLPILSFLISNNNNDLFPLPREMHLSLFRLLYIAHWACAF